jgi:hypothetical protein
VRDAGGQQLAYVYYESEPGRRSAAKLLSKDEARRIAANIAKCRSFCEGRNQISGIDSSARRTSGERLRLPLPAPAKQTYRTWRMAILLAHLNNLARFSRPRSAAHQ